MNQLRLSAQDVVVYDRNIQHEIANEYLCWYLQGIELITKSIKFPLLSIVIETYKESDTFSKDNDYRRLLSSFMMLNAALIFIYLLYILTVIQEFYQKNSSSARYLLWGAYVCQTYSHRVAITTSHGFSDHSTFHESKTQKNINHEIITSKTLTIFYNALS